MKFLNLFVFAFIFVFCIVKAENDDIKCEVLKYIDCISSANSSSAKEQCNDDGKCPNSLMKNYDKCVEQVYKNIHEDTNGLTKLLNGAAATLLVSAGSSFSFVCETSFGEYCYDSYKKAYGNSTLMNEFNCSRCGKKVLKNYKQILSYMNDENSDDYKKTKEQIDAIEICGAFANASVKITSLILIGLVSLFLMF